MTDSDTTASDRAFEEATRAFLDPRGVAVVGASADPEKLGYALARNLLL
ncbi:MAG: hypothetical protein GWN85_20585, partial [Gemmatimonadetes bacterium]|nr:hypothetical protein [Gemmatimonadota bacterium]NIR35037.1 hypothetical protein [Actinomycetota bacterium]NIS29084.1 hypothetical protein [Actinomycetota bacterium]NIT94331.1 hypothetical protein [Actinomycetota bacterium]NIU64490.1 hypothetical protein [Actinomycetota bacterium]